MAGGTASVEGMGEILQLCVSRLRGFVCFFLFAEVRSGRMSSYDPRSWGHLPKELFASSPSVKRGWRKPTWTATLGTFAFHLVLFAKIADTTSG
jgi:hypothetical protein